MPDDLMRYDLLVQNALRGAVREALRKVEKSGLPGEHHFYIAFLTQHPGVTISEVLLQRYPREMTIVLQHKYWNLAVHDDRFEVELTFDSVPEKLVIPFAALKGFLDPAVQFGLQFEEVPAEQAAAPAARPRLATVAEDTKLPESEAKEDGPKVVSLDSFRKK